MKSPKYKLPDKRTNTLEVHFSILHIIEINNYVFIVVVFQKFTFYVYDHVIRKKIIFHFIAQPRLNDLQCKKKLVQH
jgi:hypothetical protein